MKTQLIAAALLALMCGGCAVDRGDGRSNHRQVTAEDVDPAKETFALGTSVTPDGVIPADAASESFPRGSEVFLSVDVSSASTDQKIAVEWRDASGRVVRRESREVPKSARYVAFSSGKGIVSSPGAHTAVVIINGRRVMDKPFHIL